MRSAFYNIAAVKFVLRLCVRLTFFIIYTVLIASFTSAPPAPCADGTGTAAGALANAQATITADEVGNGCYNGDRDIPSGFSPIEIVWILFELGFYLDQRHQGKTSGYPARFQWKVPVTLPSRRRHVAVMALLHCRYGAVTLA